MGVMTDNENNEWRSHEPRITLEFLPGVRWRDRQITGCQRCDWTSTERSYGSAGFSAHLAELGAPDHMQEYWRFWAGIVEVSQGALDREQVAKELADYSQLMENVTEVYSELAGLSKPNTAPVYIIQGAQNSIRESHAYELAERAWYLDQDGQETAAQELRDVAEEWHEGVTEEVEESMQIRASILAGRKVETTKPL
jgi:hypothetical protein